jgi:chemotaxis protein MotB
VFLVTISACGPNANYTAPPGTTANVPANQQQVLAARAQELESRAQTLDRDNQELESLLAQSRQQISLLKDELGLVRNQLSVSNQQLADLRAANQGLEAKTEALVASVRRRTETSIQPNNSLLMHLSLTHLDGVEARQDGDLIRVELPADKLFEPGTAQLTASGRQLVESVTADVLRNYPQQVIGLEGHTEADPLRTREFPSDHHLSIARASAVYDYMVGPLRVPSAQLFVIGHGSNHPVVSNATPAGKARNRRVEVVIYPEKAGAR